MKPEGRSGQKVTKQARKGDKGWGMIHFCTPLSQRNRAVLGGIVKQPQSQVWKDATYLPHSVQCLQEEIKGRTHLVVPPGEACILELYDGASKEWVSLGAWGLPPRTISCKSLINCRIVQRERNRAEERRIGTASSGNRNTVGSSQIGVSDSKDETGLVEMEDSSKWVIALETMQ